MVTALGKPAVLSGGVVNGASFMAPVAPGGFASIFGGSLAGGAQVQEDGQTSFPTDVEGVSVLVNNVPRGVGVSLRWAGELRGARQYLVGHCVPGDGAGGGTDAAGRFGCGAGSRCGTRTGGFSSVLRVGLEPSLSRGRGY
ncbi:MAG: hypothetical protein WDO18_08560 [Acidobacteriota bacterium]